MNNYKFVYFSQQLYQKFTDYDIRFYLYELLKVSIQKNLYHFQFTWLIILHIRELQPKVIPLVLLSRNLTVITGTFLHTCISIFLEGTSFQGLLGACSKEPIINFFFMSFHCKLLSLVQKLNTKLQYYRVNDF